MSGPMISMRHHVVSLVAVFLALAIGIALGGGPLGGSAQSDADDADDAAGGAVQTVDSEGTAAYAEAFAQAGATRLYGDGLRGHAVAVLALPGADGDQVSALNDQVLAAGGASTGTYTLGDAVVDPDQEESVDSVGTELATGLADARVSVDATTYQRMGQLLAVGLATDQPTSVRADAAATTVRQVLAENDMLTSPVDVRSAPLVLVVLPPGAGGARDSLAMQELLGGLVTGLASYATGVVVTGDASSAATGMLAAVRAGAPVGPVATVDGLETAIGQVTTVLALTSVLTGAAGSYGVAGADGAVPLP